MTHRFQLIILWLFTMLGMVCHAATVSDLRITYEYYSDNRHESEQQAIQNAMTQAKQQALENKFGTDVSRIIVNQQHERIEDGDIDYTDDFFMLGGSVSRGEWIETTKEEVLDGPRYENGSWYIKVRVEGRGRMREGEPIDISYALINNVHDYDSRKIFYDGDEIFLRFSSPVSGSLLVYLIGEDKEAFCLLPYTTSSTGIYPIEANTQYLLFQQEKNFPGYALNTEKTKEQNVLYIIFSPNAITKATDRTSDKNWRGEDVPRSLSYDDFLKWLSRNQIRDEQMVVKTEVVTIKKRPRD